MYIAEIAPASHRGELVTWSYMGFALALILGASTGMVFSDLEEPARYRAILGLGMIFPILVIVTSIGVLLESPRFLLMANRSREARLVLSKINPKGYNVGAVLEDMREGGGRYGLACHLSPDASI
jgi:MFS family permease